VDIGHCRHARVYLLCVDTGVELRAGLSGYPGIGDNKHQAAVQLPRLNYTVNNY